AGRHLFGTLQQLQRGDGGMHHVDRVVTAQRLGQDVVYACAFQHGAGSATGDHTGTGAGRAQHDHTRSGLTLNRMRDGAADQRNAEEALASLLDTLGDRGGNFLGLAVADTDHAVAVADDHQSGEAEPPTTLDHLGDAVDRDDALDVVALLATVAIATTAAIATAAPPAAVTASRPAVRTRRPGGACCLLGHYVVLPIVFRSFVIRTSTHLRVPR